MRRDADCELRLNVRGMSECVATGPSRKTVLLSSSSDLLDHKRVWLGSLNVRLHAECEAEI